MRLNPAIFADLRNRKKVLLISEISKRYSNVMHACLLAHGIALQLCPRAEIATIPCQDALQFLGFAKNGELFWVLK